MLKIRLLFFLKHYSFVYLLAGTFRKEKNLVKRLFEVLVTHLEIFGEAVSVILLVEPLGIQGASHLQNLKVSFQLLGQFRCLHVKPSVSRRFLLLLLEEKHLF